ncbi:D-amino-acid dehydrogenase [Amphibacillus marinus]|uniref:D-amino-acid dehydrogenase n=1 Tax=Amphibacillus marinus TaxID=872970 RepID=A0A1H8H700_9BACI|nr:FAD-dependent oxidoreductase [Amphibacillus marinus]SEN52092.1 D-amino-acid dehydrogenase [Amphibacillus marinus]
MSGFSIIGGGIAGASIAYHLAKLGNKVTVYDRQDTGQATAASAGIICPWTSQRRNQKWYRLVKAGARYYPKFIEELEQATGLSSSYRQNGAICLFKDLHIQQLAYERISAKQADAPEMGTVKKLAPTDVKALHPHLSDLFPAVFVEGGAQVNGAQLLTVLKAGVIHYGGKWLIKDVSPEQIEDEIVIYTAGAWSREWSEQPTVRHQRAELLHFKLTDQINYANTPVVMALGPMYIVEMEAEGYAIGTTHDDTESFEVKHSQENQRYLHEQAARYFTDYTIQDQQVAVGLRPFTDQSLPFIGFVKKRLFVVNGLGSSGLTAAPVIGREVADYLTGKKTELNLLDYQC